MKPKRAPIVPLVIFIDAYSHNHFAAEAVRAEEVRPEVEKALSRGRRVTFDFTGVRSLSQTFADELIGRLVERRGEAVLAQVDFLGCNQTVLTILAYTSGAALRAHRERNAPSAGPTP